MTEVLLKIFVKDYKNTSSAKVREKYGTLSGFVGIFCNLLLCAFKIIAGLVTKSISVIADGLNNLTDMGSSLITVICFKLSGKPADSDHPFGHGRMEYISALIVSGLILVVGFELLISSVKALINGEAAPSFSRFSLIVLAVSIIVKLLMFVFNRSLSKRIDSAALLATAKDSAGDSVATAAILAAALVAKFIDLPFNLDAVMAVGVALFILWAGFSSGKETVDEMLGGPPSEELINELEQGIMSFGCFLGIHDLIVHNYGPGRQFASVHVEVPQNVDIVECHEKIDLCEKVVSEKTGVSLVIHMDPIDTESEAVSSTKMKLVSVIEEIDPKLSLHDFRMTPLSENRTNLIFDVVVPYEVKIEEKELYAMISERAKQIDKTFECVITFDKSFVK